MHAFRPPARLGADDDKLRLGTWDGYWLWCLEELPFAVVREILSKVGFTPDVHRHFYSSLCIRNDEQIDH
jgi:hypothetical protein